VEQLEAAIPLAQEINSANVEGALTMNAGDAYARLGVHDKALEMFQRGIEVTRRLNLPWRNGRSLRRLADAYFEMGDRAAAERTITEAIDQYEKGRDRTGQAETRATLGRMLYASGETNRALELFMQVRPIPHDAPSPRFEAEVLTNWAEIEMDRGSIDSAIAKLDEALKLSRAVTSPTIEQKALYVRALAL